MEIYSCIYLIFFFFPHFVDFAHALILGVDTGSWKGEGRGILHIGVVLNVRS